MKIRNHQFDSEEVVLDFHDYEGCEFNKCRFVVLGYGPFTLNKCEVHSCEFSFAGPAAGTIQTMANIYRIGDQGKALIEATFESIRSGRTTGQAKAD
ncbi:MAG: hypothetical protein ACQCXQ_08150 [Verrucomicrobiales bacterium]|nr:hypothetical protein [Verrucomicrobiota bacterium JB025]